MIEALKYGFYTVDPDYLEYLNKVDSEVYYNPFIGAIVGIENYNYFIPVSSAKKKIKDGKMCLMNILSILDIKNMRFAYL